MFTEIKWPQALSREELDDYLDRGWFRMEQMIFTCSFLCFDDHLYSAIWIRLDLNGYQFKKRLRKLMRKNAERFRVEIKRAVLDQEKEHLYQLHKQRFTGYIAPSLQNSLMGECERNIYETWETCIYDGDKLVGASFFDVGKESVASIMGLFNPDYAQFSLGFYTMLLEIQYSLQNNKQFFYPGYVVPGYDRFDYKLKIGGVDYYNNKTNSWLPYNDINHNEQGAEKLQAKLKELQVQLQEAGIHNKIYLYPLYDKNLYGYDDLNFLRHPAFLSCLDHPKQTDLLLVEFDLIKNCYRLYHARKLNIGLPTIFLFEFLKYYNAEKSYLDFIVLRKLILESEDVEHITDALKVGIQS